MLAQNNPTMIKTYYDSYKELGLKVIGIEWDVKKKSPVSHRLWSEADSLKLLSSHNGIMVKADGVWACLDFDIKNTERKTIFKEWEKIVLYQRPDVYNKLFIEETRSQGYHVWLKYNKLQKKLELAESDKGSEVIALYAKGPLIYTYPTPGYTEYSSSMEDVQDLNDEEFEYLISTSQGFNEYKPNYDPTLKAISYPAGYEHLLSEFDKNIPDEYWETILREIGLEIIQDYKYTSKDKFTAFRRSDSASEAISAKVYYRTKRALIFSASLHDYPNWHNRADYPVWCLPPSFVLFYKNGRDWPATVEYIQDIIDSIGIEITAPPPPASKTDYPLEVFPDSIRRSILEVAQARSLAPQFLATSALWTVSSMAGTHYSSDFNGDAKNILFCLLIAPVSVGKTPAFKSMCETPLKKIQESADKNYAFKAIEYENKKADAMHSKKKFIDKKPRRFIPFAVDGTTEGYVTLSMDQPNGIGVYHDEAETIFNAGSFKGTNDSISFFTQAFSGGRFTQVRADRDKERIVPNMNINLMMGTQPSRLANIFTVDRLSSGFASRFLMVESDYIQLNEDTDPFAAGKEMCFEWVDLLNTLYRTGELYNAGEIEKIEINMSESVKQVYRQYYKTNLVDANKRILSKAEQYIIGTEAKMSNYFPRLVQILSIIHSPAQPVITEQTIHDAYKLYRYYSDSTINIISRLNTEINTGLPESLELLYQALPDKFARKDAAEICTRLNLSPQKFEIAMRRKDFKVLFKKIEYGTYQKI